MEGQFPGAGAFPLVTELQFLENGVMNSEFDHEDSRMRQRAVVETLNERRKAVNMSLRDLETLSGIRHSTISDLFRKYDIRLWQVFVLAKALDMAIPQLIMMADARYHDLLRTEAEQYEYE